MNKLFKYSLMLLALLLIIGCSDNGGSNGNSESNDVADFGKFDVNEGIGGFASGGYDEDAIHPTSVGWTRQSRFKGPDNPEIIDVIELPGDIKSQKMEPTIDKDGNIYIKINDRDENDGIFKFDRQGNEIWRKDDYHEEYDISPGLYEGRATLITENNQIITTLDQRHVAGLDADTGEFNFVFEIESNVGLEPWEPSIGHDGTIYFVHDSTLVALDSDGSEKWRYVTADDDVEETGADYTPVITEDRIYLKDWYYVTALDLEGNLLWTADVGHVTKQEQSNILVDNEGNIYLAQRERLISYTKDGELRWDEVVDEDGRYLSTYQGLALTEDGLLIGIFNPHVYAYDLDGNQVWKSERFPHFGGVAVDSEGISYISGTRALFAFDTEGNIKWELEIPSGYGGNVVIGPNQELFVTTEGKPDSIYIVGEQ